MNTPRTHALVLSLAGLLTAAGCQSNTTGTDAGGSDARGDRATNMDAGGSDAATGFDSGVGRVDVRSDAAPPPPPDGQVKGDGSADDCAQYTSCDDCTPENGCGWCGASGRCVTGDENGQLAGTCGGDWAWTSDECVGDGGAASDADSCGAQTTCGTCTPEGGCGWCSATNRCVEGDESGPLVGACAGDWAWTEDECPADAAVPPPG